MTAVEDRLAEIEAWGRELSDASSGPPEQFEAAEHISTLTAALRAVLAEEDFLSDEVGHLVYEATEMESEECTDECPACAIEDMYAAIAAALGVTR